MTQPAPIEQYDPQAIEDYRQQAHAFLTKAREYLAAEDLHQAPEKGRGAAAWMARAVAVSQGWEYNQHAHFGVVCRSVSDITGDDRILDLSAVAYGLHRGCSTRKCFLSERTIARNLDQMSELIELLEPLTLPANGLENN